MAHKKYAHAKTTNASVQFEEWMDVIREQNDSLVSKDKIHRIAKNVLRKADPNQFLLSHATIVASVDTYSPKNVKTGRMLNHGVQIDVRFPDYRISSECQDIINNNHDAWARPLLLSTYRTFIGAHNYLEHIQVPELSKGFIVDSVARDIGRSCYIDILVATDRKHNQLVSDILSGEIDSLSMGCTSQFTICTHCGNVAVDDSQLCPCIAYSKGHVFIDDDGNEARIAELIGHVSVPNSNQFIEASWVHNPAFAGAVRRNILNPDTVQVAASVEKASFLNQLRAEIPEFDGIKKAASVSVVAQDDEPEPPPDMKDEPESQGDEPSGVQDSGSEEEKTEPKSADSFDSQLDKMQEIFMQTMMKKLQDKLSPKPEDVGSTAPADISSSNENLVHAAFKEKLNKHFPNNPKLVRWASNTFKQLQTRKPVKLSSKDAIVFSWIVDKVNGRNIDPKVYNTVIASVSLLGFPSQNSYLAFCQMKIGKVLTNNEKRTLINARKIAQLSNL